MAELQFPNIVGQFQQGQDRGRALLANNLAGQAYSATGDQQKSLLGQLAGVNPQLAVSMTGQLQSQQIQQQATQQAQDVDHSKKVQGAANFMVQALQSKDPARIQGAWQAVHPYFSDVASSQGVTLPDQWNDSLTPGLYKILGQNGGMPQQKGTVVAPGGALVDSATGQQMFANPAAQQYHDVPMGDGKAAGVFDPATGSIRPATVGGAQPAGDPMQPFIDQANHAVQLGADPAKVQAWLVSQAQGAGLQPHAGGAPPTQGQPQATAQFGIGTPKPSASGTPSGYRLKPDGSGSLEPIPGGPADKSGAGNVSLGDPNQSGPAYLASIDDPSMRSQIQAIAEGRMPLPKVSRPGKNGEISPQTIQQAVAQYDPSYDQADPTSRIKARNDFTSGKSGVQLRQLNTLLGHLGGLADAVDKLGNTGSTIVNSAENAVGSTYNTKVSNFDAAARPAAEEFAALLKGGVPSVEEIKSAHELLNANRTPDQLHGVIGTMAAQIQSRIAALHAQAQNSLGPFASKVTIITPEGQAALDKLRERGLIGKFDAGEQGGQQSAPPQQSAQPRAINPQTGHAIVWNGSAWVPE